MSTQNLKFIHLSTGSASTHKADTGAIIFEKATGRIAVATGANTDVEYYGGGRVSDATFDTVGKVLTLSFNDGSDAIKLDFSDTASATGVNAIMKAHADRISALETTVGDSKSGLVKDVADNKTAIDAINNTSTGILAEAKKYTNGKIGDIGDKTVSVYVDDAKTAAIEAAKTYADTTFDTKGSAAAAQTAATEAAKNYTDGKVSEINTTTDGLRTDVDALKGTVGNASSGLVKDVADNADAITALQDLHANKTGESGKMKVIDEINAKVGDIKINDKAVTVKEYVDAGDAKALAAAKKYTDTEIGKVNTAANDLGTRVTTLETKVGSSTDGADAEGSVYARIAKNAADITTLVGTDAAKSVRTIANEELVKQLIPSGASESLDTLQEIAAWIQAHPGDASEMNKKIGDLEGIVGKPAGDNTEATGLVKGVKDNKSSIDAHNGRITKLEALHAKGTHDGYSTVAEEVKAGIAGITAKSASNAAESDVVVTVTTEAGSVKTVAVDAGALAGKVTANTNAITAEVTRAKEKEEGLRNDLGQITDASTVTTTAFGRIKALEEKQSSGTLMWSVWD